MVELWKNEQNVCSKPKASDCKIWIHRFLRNPKTGQSNRYLALIDHQVKAKFVYENRKDFTEKHKEIARIEAKVYRFSEILSEQRTSSVENVQRKQARTGDERDEEDDDVISVAESDEDEEVIYNPKNLPLGWDGKVGTSATESCF